MARVNYKNLPEWIENETKTTLIVERLKAAGNLDEAERFIHGPLRAAKDKVLYLKIRVEDSELIECVLSSMYSATTVFSIPGASIEEIRVTSPGTNDVIQWLESKLDELRNP